MCVCDCGWVKVQVVCEVPILLPMVSCELCTTGSPPPPPPISIATIGAYLVVGVSGDATVVNFRSNTGEGFGSTIVQVHSNSSTSDDSRANRNTSSGEGPKYAPVAAHRRRPVRVGDVQVGHVVGEPLPQTMEVAVRVPVQGVYTCVVMLMLMAPGGG